MSNVLVKLSLLAQYLRIFEQKKLRIICKAAFVLISVWGLSYTFFAWFPCFPPDEFWAVGKETHCYGYGARDPGEVYQTTVSATTSNMAFDLVIWSLPIYLLFRHETARKTKTAVVCLLVLGTMIITIAAGRVVANRATAKSKPDPFNDFPVILLLGETENRLACILGSVPIFWPVMSNTLYRIFVTHEFTIQSSRRLPITPYRNAIIVRNPSTGEIIPNASAGTTSNTSDSQNHMVELGLGGPSAVPQSDLSSPARARGIVDPLRFDDDSLVASEVTIAGPSRKLQSWQPIHV